MLDTPFRCETGSVGRGAASRVIAGLDPGTRHKGSPNLSETARSFGTNGPPGPRAGDGEARVKVPGPSSGMASRLCRPAALVVPAEWTGEPGRPVWGGPWATRFGAVHTRWNLIPAPRNQSGDIPGERRRDLDRTEKREFVAGLNAALAETSMVVVTRNQGLTVAEATDLRRRMRAAGATFKVAKNRLTLLALDGTRFDGIKPMLTGPTALAWSTDPVAVAKTTVEFARTNEKLVLIGGALGPQMLNADGVKALAELPGLDELRARIVGMISTPATRVAGVLQGSAGQLARVFGAFARKNEEEQPAAA